MEQLVGQHKYLVPYTMPHFLANYSRNVAGHTQGLGMVVMYFTRFLYPYTSLHNIFPLKEI